MKLDWVYKEERFDDEKKQNHRNFLEVIRKAESESLYTKAVQQSVQRQWSKWQDYIKRDMKWHNLLKSTPLLVSFCLGATHNTMASPQNWGCWELEDDLECALCRKEQASVTHILAGCQEALQSGRYTFCHNVVLRVIAHEMQVMTNQVKKKVGKVYKDSIITFYKKGE